MASFLISTPQNRPIQEYSAIDLTVLPTPNSQNPEKRRPEKETVVKLGEAARDPRNCGSWSYGSGA
jgi:hypothetical protein